MVFRQEKIRRKGQETQQHRTRTKQGQPGLGSLNLSSNVLTRSKDFSEMIHLPLWNRCVERASVPLLSGF